MITTVIFDLDDTLYDEINFCRSGFRAAVPHIAALSDAYSADDVFAILWQCFITGDCGSTFNVAIAQLGIPCDGPLMHKLVEVYRTHTPTLTLPPESLPVLEDLKGRCTPGLPTDNETKDFIDPNRMGLLTIQLLRPSGLYRRPSPLPDAAPRVKIAAIGELPAVLAQFAECP